MECKQELLGKRFVTFTQEQVDKIFFEAAMAANKQRIPLSKLAVEETGMGVVEDKVIKNHYAAEYMYNAYKRVKTCGVIEEDKSYGIKKIAEPVGLVGAVIPTTNPTSTAIFKCLICLKTRNAILISPHPRAKKCTAEAARIVLEAAVKAGAPEGIIGCIEEPTIELSNELMKAADVILATGGPGMVKAAYSSGKPAIGVGPGNTPVIMDSSCDIPTAVYSVIHSKTFDNGMICASEQSVTAIADIYDAVKKEFVKRGCHVLNKTELDQVRGIILTEAGTVNPKIVGQPAYKIAAMAGVTVPADTKILIGEVTSVDVSEPFAHEKLSPVLALYKAKDFDTALDMSEQLIADGGYGHTSSLYVHPSETEKLAKHAARMKTCRILVNTPSSHGPELQVDLGFQHPLQLVTGIASDLLQHGALFADDDSLVGISLADDRRININDIASARPFLHPVNGNCDSMRNLLIQCMKCFLTDDFCCDLTLWLICNCIFIIKHRSIRKIFKNTWNDILCIISAKCRTRNDLCKVTDLTVSIDGRKKFLFFHSIDLVDDQDYRNAYLLKLLRNMTLSCSHKSRWLYQPHDSIHFLQGSLCNLHHVFTKLVFCLVDTRGIKKYDLTLITGINSLDLVSCCLRFIGCDRNLLSDQMVHQCGFSNIRSSDDRNKA